MRNELQGEYEESSGHCDEFYAVVHEWNFSNCWRRRRHINDLSDFSRTLTAERGAQALLVHAKPEFEVVTTTELFLVYFPYPYLYIYLNR